jgi:hypothetical protein
MVLNVNYLVRNATIILSGLEGEKQRVEKQLVDGNSQPGFAG